MSKTTQVFINYRHIDCKPLADYLVRELQAKLRPGTWFLDTETIGYGKEIGAEILAHLEPAAVLLVLIGPNWHDVKDKDGDRRLMNSKDWVRHEIELAREKGKLILPLLYQNERFTTDICPWLHNKVPDLAFLSELKTFSLQEDQLETQVPKLLEYLRQEAGITLLEAESAPQNPAANSLREDLDRHFPIAPEYRTPTSPTPFKGLPYFDKKDAALFFGRSEEILRLCRAVRNFPLVLLYGQSGVGKSSILNAGLIPRMEEQYRIQYLRRDKELGYDQQLGALTFDHQPSLLLLDQVEEIFTDPQPGPGVRQAEEQNFFDQLATLRQSQPQLKVLLGFRSEYFAKVRSLLEKRYISPVSDQELYLHPLSGEGLREAILGVAQQEALANRYRFKVEEALADALFHDLQQSEQPEAHTTPLLQYQLRRLWEHAARNRSDDAEWLCLRAEDYRHLRKASLGELLDERLAQLGQHWPAELKSGLVLELLYAFTTEQQTATALSDPVVRQQYAQMPDFDALFQYLQDHSALLLRIGTTQQPRTRLAHDTFSPLIRERHQASDAIVQRARRILDTKQREVQHGTRPRFSETDLETVREGLPFMPELPNQLRDYMEEDEKRYLRQKQERFELALTTAQQQLEDLQLDAALAKLEIAQREELHPQQVLTVARQLPYPLSFLSAEKPFADTLRLLAVLQPDAQWANSLKHLPKWPTAQLFQEWEAWLQEQDPELLRDMRERFFPHLVDIPGGQFVMGMEEGLPAYPQEQPDHPVQISAFQLADTPVTCWQFGLFCLDTGRPLPRDSGFGRGERPVINVSWYDAIAYCNWLSLQQGFTPAYRTDDLSADPQEWHQQVKDWADFIDWTADGYRLPTEAEWEYAAGGGAANRSRYGNGKDLADPAEINFDAENLVNKDLVKFGWIADAIAGSMRGTTTPVKHFASTNTNPFKLHDMSGNVYDWCWDWYSEGDNSYYAQCKAQGQIPNPTGPESGDSRVVRGGSWIDFASVCRSSYRFRIVPIDRINSLGFRVSRRPNHP